MPRPGRRPGRKGKKASHVTLRRHTRKTRVSRSLATTTRMVTIKEWLNASTAATIALNNSAGSYFTQSAGYLFQFATPAAVGTSYGSVGMQFSLSDLPGVVSYWSHLYDRYRIRRVMIRFVPCNTGSLFWLGGSQNCGVFLHSALDMDDSNAPTPSDAGMDTLRRRPSYKVKNWANGRGNYKYSVVPHVSDAIYGGSTFTSYGNAPNSQWIDMNSYGAPYYGFKWVLEVINNTSAFSTINFKLELGYVFQLKDPI